LVCVRLTASQVTVRNCRFIGNDASNDNFINMVALDDLRVYDSYFATNTAQTAEAAMINATGAVTNTDIRNCSFRDVDDAALFIISDQTDNSGCITNCYFSSTDVAGAINAGLNWTGGHFFECYVSGEADSWGLIGGGAQVYNNAA